MSASAELEKLKQSFLARVRPEDIHYNWLGGCCYASGVEPPLYDDRLASDEARAAFLEWVGDWVEEHRGELYCCPDLINELQEGLPEDQQMHYMACLRHTKRSLFKTQQGYLQYVEGFLDLKRNYSCSADRRGDAEKTALHLRLLEEWVSDQKALLKFDSMFEAG